MNFLTKVIDATPTGGRIEMTTRARPDEGQVKIAVADTGRGISPRTTRRSSKKPGPGLGLFITVEIVPEQKGRIEIESDEGRGSTFRVVLPAKERAA